MKGNGKAFDRNYEKALGLKEVCRKTGDGFTIVYLGDAATGFRLELTQLTDRTAPYDPDGYWIEIVPAR